MTVISHGRRNNLAGPDYLDAVLLVDGRLEVGAVEMHLRESDWFAHGHQNDPAYDSVRLHVLGCRQGPLRLALPAVYADDLIAIPSSSISSSTIPAAGITSHTPIGPDILAELAWRRLLRRVTVIIRAEPELAAGDRIRRAFIRGLFDCLGYTANREPMRMVAEGLLRSEPISATFDDIATAIFALACLPPGKVIAAGGTFTDTARLHAIAGNGAPDEHPGWRYATRPANAPERRLWAGAVLLHEIYHNDLFARLRTTLMTEGFGQAATLLVVRAGHESYAGIGRCREIVMNAFMPVLLASGILAGRREHIELACRSYREAPSLESNSIIRAVERRYPSGTTLVGGFWQQGAIEFHQRYLATDKTGLSFIAERPGREGNEPAALS